VDLSLPSLSLAQLLQRLVATVVVIGVYGWTIAFVADRLGDPGPRYDGRRTLNPLSHLDIAGLVAGLFFRVAWVPRVDVDVTKLRFGVGGAALVVAAGSVALAVLSLLALHLRPLLSGFLPDDVALTVSGVLNATSTIAIATAAIGLLPLPPFGGALVIALGDRARSVWNGPTVRLIGIALVIAVGLAGWLPSVVSQLDRGWRSLVGF
jgi:hypothetical protein